MVNRKGYLEWCPSPQKWETVNILRESIFGPLFRKNKNLKQKANRRWLSSSLSRNTHDERNRNGNQPVKGSRDTESSAVTQVSSTVSSDCWVSLQQQGSDTYNSEGKKKKKGSTIFLECSLFLIPQYQHPPTPIFGLIGNLPALSQEFSNVITWPGMTEGPGDHRRARVDQDAVATAGEDDEACGVDGSSSQPHGGY